MSAEAALRTRFVAGDPRALARALTWAADGDVRAERLLASLARPAVGGWVVGLTGPPGVGKSTLVDALVVAWRAEGRRVAVLAVDPSAPAGGGALLGDRVRLVRGAEDPGVFVRSLGSRGRGGGLSPGLPTSLALLRAFGFERVVLETVGAGQAEYEVAALADTVVAVWAPGLGDDVQAAKAGLLDVADVLVVGKSDRPGADRAARELRDAVADREAAGARGRSPPVVRLAVGAAAAERPPDLAADGGLAAFMAVLAARAAAGADDGRSATRTRLVVEAHARELLARALAGLPQARWAALGRGEAVASELAAEALAAASAAAEVQAVAARPEAADAPPEAASRRSDC